MDIHMGEYNGLELAQQILAETPMKIVFLSGFNLIEYREQAIALGAYGFLDKNISIEELVKALIKVDQEDEKIFPPIEAANENYYSLTDREKEILQLLSQGLKQLAVADELNISERTLRNHIYSINTKLECQYALSSVIKAIELGIINVHLQ